MGDEGLCRTCGAEIVWIKSTNGRPMIMDAQLIEFVDDRSGTESLVTASGRVYKKVRTEITADDAGKRRVGRVSHWATCPDRQQHRDEVKERNE